MFSWGKVTLLTPAFDGLERNVVVGLGTGTDGRHVNVTFAVKR